MIDNWVEDLDATQVSSWIIVLINGFLRLFDIH